LHAFRESDASDEGNEDDEGDEDFGHNLFGHDFDPVDTGGRDAADGTPAGGATVIPPSKKPKVINKTKVINNVFFLLCLIFLFFFHFFVSFFFFFRPLPPPPLPPPPPPPHLSSLPRYCSSINIPFSLFYVFLSPVDRRGKEKVCQDVPKVWWNPLVIVGHSPHVVNPGRKKEGQHQGRGAAQSQGSA
jgi:hypothetical protein